MNKKFFLLTLGAVLLVAPTLTFGFTTTTTQPQGVSSTQTTNPLSQDLEQDLDSKRDDMKQDLELKRDADVYRSTDFRRDTSPRTQTPGVPTDRTPGVPTQR